MLLIVPRSALFVLYNTVLESAINFNPQLHITNGCHPYPAVDADGNTSGGLNPTGSSSAGCKGSGYGSQIYGRSAWYNGVWAIMYSWYFPKDSPLTGFGHRHDWEHVVVWLKNPAVSSPEILAVSVAVQVARVRRVVESAVQYGRQH
ncbi:unnamed protein product [Phytophthora lilii]|uniref:Unnamed protein product n=1 Tax=Phytophthora lilii TaxID=2077276 RepID=A0A9W6X3C1_9STRA|nr:unnamed protein product [Phytophthora lilii]